MEQLNCTNNTSNSSSTASSVSWNSSHLVPAVILSICFVLGVPGNLAVIIRKPNFHHMSSLSQSLMLNLAISDLLCLLTLPFWIYPLLYNWTLGLVTCKVLAYVLYCSMYGSMLTITVLSVQRCLQVVYQQKCLDQVGKKRILVLLWLVVMTLYSPVFLVRELTKDQRCKTSCRPKYSSQAQWMVVLLTESLMGFGSFSVVTFSYICLHRKVNQAAFFNNPQTTRLVASIIVAFFVLWIPYHTINVMAALAFSLNNEGLLKLCKDSWNIVGALTAVNSCLNPILYTFTSQNMRIMCSGQNSEN
ncbi:leukotriene B4 receptor 1-like [Scomber scombrus]|uniref:Leukotriene B4 receptor 1-like n=1 Tax=Scomber scombrus TaxID=13677 RepID=A0AAV1NRR6_SCOSC|nr:C3a anaphylatoxin chemotactic receptor-like [Scomber scombrus]